jgi:predicted ATP-dependent endonuclease of OLD family
MELRLKNIGTIEDSNIKLNGLTVIAGENDTGKSTLGKVLFALIKADNIAFKQNATMQKAKEILATRFNLIFDGNVTQDGSITLLDEHKEIAYVEIVDQNYIKELRRNTEANSRFFDATIIQSPIVFDMVDFFSSISKMRERQKFDYELDFDITYPYVIWDLFDKISRENPFPKIKVQQEIQNEIQQLICGEFKQEGGKFFYYKYLQAKAVKSEMVNTAFGIKSFGLLQLLNANRFLSKKMCLILDEPEVHLHPKWQLKMAHVIVKIAKKGIKVLVNSHSPYMVEALQRYSEIEKVDTNFYIAKENKIEQIDGSNGKTLEEIFCTLSEPFEEFEQMDGEKF